VRTHGQRRKKDGEILQTRGLAGSSGLGTKSPLGGPDVKIKPLLGQGWKISLYSQQIVVFVKKVWVPQWSSFYAQLWMFFIWCQRTPLDELYSIIDPLIDVERGLYESVSIHEVSTFHSEKKMSYGRLLSFFTTIPVFVQKRTFASFSIQTSFDSSEFVFSPVTFLKNALY
jgi:hypothetical protein